MALALAVPVMAAQQSLASVTGQAQIQPMGDGSGKYCFIQDIKIFIFFPAKTRISVSVFSPFL